MSTAIGEYYLFPSTLFAETLPHQVKTILGSCVAVCLFDQVLHHGGINHYMLPWWNGNGMPSPKYGDIAIERLIEKMIFLGSKKGNLVAKIFGGANQLTYGKLEDTVGERNIVTAEKMLSEHGIRIIGRNTGGEIGRQIIFHTQTNQVFMKYLQSTELKRAI